MNTHWRADTKHKTKKDVIETLASPDKEDVDVCATSCQKVELCTGFVYETKGKGSRCHLLKGNFAEKAGAERFTVYKKVTCTKPTAAPTAAPTEAPTVSGPVAHSCAQLDLARCSNSAGCCHALGVIGVCSYLEAGCDLITANYRPSSTICIWDLITANYRPSSPICIWDPDGARMPRTILYIELTVSV